ncbi:MAG TPA: hypothetical protein VJB59_04440 [Bdellovibrionota bacterium]|nr:hypothetical protein [Bdellovibrionota bacterium]
MEEIPVDPALFLELFPELRDSAACITFLFLWAYTHGRGTPTGRFDIPMISEGTALEPAEVERCLTVLLERGLIVKISTHEYSVYWPWHEEDDASAESPVKIHPVPRQRRRRRKALRSS